jgi:hypothetical protein
VLGIRGRTRIQFATLRQSLVIHDLAALRRSRAAADINLTRAWGYGRTTRAALTAVAVTFSGGG